MTTITVEQAVSDRKTTLRKWDSPWLNGKLLWGLIILLAVISIEFVGPLFWDTKLALIGAGRTNVVPIWVEPDVRLGFKQPDPAHPLGTLSARWPMW
jgi:hypothetical protein